MSRPIRICFVALIIFISLILFTDSYAANLNMPNGVAFRGGALYVAEVNRILRFDGIEDRLKSPPTPVVVNRSFPDDAHHGWKYIAAILKIRQQGITICSRMSNFDR